MSEGIDVTQQIDIAAILSNAGADADAPEGSQAWALAQVAAAVAAYAKDAARYQWLVENCQDCPDALGMGGQLYFGTYSGMDGIDYAIDAEIARVGGGK